MLVVPQWLRFVVVVARENKVGLSCLDCLGTADNTQLFSSTVTHSEKERREMKEKREKY
jgi:hypothetical protein